MSGAQKHAPSTALVRATAVVGRHVFLYIVGNWNVVSDVHPNIHRVQHLHIVPDVHKLLHGLGCVSTA